MSETSIRRSLLALRDEAYRDFMIPLIPTVDPARVIGVRTPALRALARDLTGTPEAAAFLRALPHGFFEEDQLHAFLIARERGFDAALALTEAFLPYVDNWATCDQFSPAVFARRPEALLPAIEVWLASERPYTVRFGIGMLMRYFLDERFDPAYPDAVAALRAEDYYVRMMAAWYFATGLAKRFDDFLPYLEQGRLSPRVHAMTVRKAVESRRLTEEQKNLLRSLCPPLDRRESD